MNCAAFYDGTVVRRVRRPNMSCMKLFIGEKKNEKKEKKEKRGVKSSDPASRYVMHIQAGGRGIGQDPIRLTCSAVTCTSAVGTRGLHLSCSRDVHERKNGQIGFLEVCMYSRNINPVIHIACWGIESPDIRSSAVKTSL